MNLYNIYDPETGEYIRTNVTAKVMSMEFGVSEKLVSQIYRRGHRICRKYKLEKSGVMKDETPPRYDNMSVRVMREWDQVTGKARAYFAYLRKRKGLQ